MTNQLISTDVLRGAIAVMKAQECRLRAGALLEQARGCDDFARLRAGALIAEAQCLEAASSRTSPPASQSPSRSDALPEALPASIRDGA